MSTDQSSYFRHPTYGVQKRLGAPALERMQGLYNRLCDGERTAETTGEIIAVSRILRAHGIDPEA